MTIWMRHTLCLHIMCLIGIHKSLLFPHAVTFSAFMICVHCCYANYVCVVCKSVMRNR